MVINSPLIGFERTNQLDPNQQGIGKIGSVSDGLSFYN